MSSFAISALDLESFHASLRDPLLDSMNFLNEVTLRYPDAISFAPGRPYEKSFDASRIGDLLTVYADHLQQERGLSSAQVSSHLFQYGRTNGHIHELIARTIQNDEGITVPPEAIVVTVGCQEGIFIALRTLFNSDDDVLLVASPCYVGVTGAARLLDIAVEAVPERKHGLDPRDVAATANRLRAEGKRPRALYLVPDFANPSGASLAVDARGHLLEVAREHDLILLEDDPYGFFLREGEPRPTLKAMDFGKRVIHFGTFAKTVLPGARVGYVVADQDVVSADGYHTLLADELSKVKSMITVNTPTLSQAVIGGFLIENNFRLRDANAEAIEFYRKNMDSLLGALEECFPKGRREALGISWNRPGGGFFVSMDLPFAADIRALETCAAAHGVLWTPMRFFHPGGGGDHTIRLSCSYLAPDRIEEGIGRLAAFITQHVPTGQDD